MEGVKHELAHDPMERKEEKEERAKHALDFTPEHPRVRHRACINLDVKSTTIILKMSRHGTAENNTVRREDLLSPLPRTLMDRLRCVGGVVT